MSGCSGRFRLSSPFSLLIWNEEDGVEVPLLVGAAAERLFAILVEDELTLDLKALI